MTFVGLLLICLGVIGDLYRSEQLESRRAVLIARGQTLIDHVKINDKPADLQQRLDQFREESAEFDVQIGAFRTGWRPLCAICFFFGLILFVFGLVRWAVVQAIHDRFPPSRE